MLTLSYINKLDKLRHLMYSMYLRYLHILFIFFFLYIGTFYVSAKILPISMKHILDCIKYVYAMTLIPKAVKRSRR